MPGQSTQDDSIHDTNTFYRRTMHILSEAQVPFLARRARVVTIDPRGNGRSDRPEDPAAYGFPQHVADTVADRVRRGLGRGPDEDHPYGDGKDRFFWSFMAAVFISFTFAPDVGQKMIGIGLGLAILIDVLIVRLVITPAVVTLLGDRAWWLPGRMDRLLPNVSLEGHLEAGIDRELTEEPEEPRVPVGAP